MSVGCRPVWKTNKIHLGMKGEGSIDCAGYVLLANTLPPFEDEASACLVALVMSERERARLRI